jgi:hypothetical protein
MTINTGTFKSMRELNTMYEPVLKEVYTQTVKEQPDYLPYMFNISGTSKERENYEGVGAQGLMKPWNSTGKAVNYEDREKLFPSSIPQIKYSIGTQIDRDWMDFNKHQDIKDEVIKLADSVYNTRQYQGVEFAKNAFTTTGTDYLGQTVVGGTAVPDGKALCANDHPRSPTDTTTGVDNLISTSLDYDSWHEAQVIGQSQWTDSKGNLMPVTFDCLMVHPRLMSVAFQLAGMNAKKADQASATYVPEQANFSLNIYRGTFDVVVNPYLPNAYNWFAINKSRMRRFHKWNEFRKPDFKNETDFDTEVFKYAVVGLWGKGTVDHSWILGSDASS